MEREPKKGGGGKRAAGGGAAVMENEAASTMEEVLEASDAMRFVYIASNPQANILLIPDRYTDGGRRERANVTARFTSFNPGFGLPPVGKCDLRMVAEHCRRDLSKAVLASDDGLGAAGYEELRREVNAGEEKESAWRDPEPAECLEAILRRTLLFGMDGKVVPYAEWWEHTQAMIKAAKLKKEAEEAAEQRKLDRQAKFGRLPR